MSFSAPTSQAQRSRRILPWLLYLYALVLFALHFVRIFDNSFWGDEGFSIGLAQMNVFEMLQVTRISGTKRGDAVLSFHTAPISSSGQSRICLSSVGSDSLWTHSDSCLYSDFQTVRIDSRSCCFHFCLFD